MATSNNEIKDPCAEFGPTQKWAVVWMLSVIVLGSLLTYKLACIDGEQYDKKGVYLDYDAYHKNRDAQSGLASERIDSRQKVDYATTQKGLE